MNIRLTTWINTLNMLGFHCLQMEECLMSGTLKEDENKRNICKQKASTQGGCVVKKVCDG